MTTQRRNITVDERRWNTLQALSMRMVRDSELSPDMPKGGVATGRVSAMMRLIADGVLKVTRPGSAEHDEQ